MPTQFFVSRTDSILSFHKWKLSFWTVTKPRNDESVLFWRLWNWRRYVACCGSKQRQFSDATIEVAQGWAKYLNLFLFFCCTLRCKWEHCIYKNGSRILWCVWNLNYIHAHILHPCHASFWDLHIRTVPTMTFSHTEEFRLTAKSHSAFGGNSRWSWASQQILARKLLWQRRALTWWTDCTQISGWYRSMREQKLPTNCSADRLQGRTVGLKTRLKTHNTLLDILLAADSQASDICSTRETNTPFSFCPFF